MFNLFDVGGVNETKDGYTCITNNSTVVWTEIKIKFNTYSNLVESKHLEFKKIVEWNTKLRKKQIGKIKGT